MDMKIWGRKYSYKEREPLNFPRRPLSMEISLVIDPKCTEAHMLKKKKEEEEKDYINFHCRHCGASMVSD